MKVSSQTEWNMNYKLFLGTSLIDLGIRPEIPGENSSLQTLEKRIKKDYFLSHKNHTIDFEWVGFAIVWKI